jgi:hypothetical protein
VSAAAPIAYARDHIIFDSAGRAASLYRVPTTTYGLLPDKDKWVWLLTTAGLALGAQSDITIMRLNRQYPTSDYVRQASGLVDTQLQDRGVWERFLKRHEPRLELLDSHEPEVYLRVAHDKPLDHGRLWRTIDRAIRRANEAFGIGQDAPVPQREITARQRHDELVLDRLCGAMPGVRPVTPGELQWMCRRAATRGVAEPLMDPNWEPDAFVVFDDRDDLAYTPCSSDFRRLFACVTRRERDEDLDYLVVSGEGPTTYQAFLTLGTLPKDIDFPGAGAELMSAPADALRRPVDTSAHCEWVTNKRALREVERKIRNADVAIADAFEAMRSPNNRHLMAPELARELQEVLMHESKPPMFDVTVSYALSAGSLEDLRADVDSFREQFPGMSVHMAPGEQDRQFYAHLPSPTTVVTDWAQRMSLDQVGMLMPCASRGVGDQYGAYFGHTLHRGRPRTPVLIDPTKDAQDAQPSVIYAAGRQGGGKTVSMEWYTLLAAMRGSRCYTLDPGRDHHITELSELEGQSALVEILAREQNRGMLDPLVTAPPELQDDVALTYLTDLLHTVDAAGTRELQRAIRAAREKGTGMLGVVAELAAGNAVAQDLADALGIVSEFGLATLGFSNGKVHTDTALPRVTTFRLANLGLPSATQPRHTYDPRQRVAVATFKITAAHILGRLMEDRNIHKVFGLDEGWVLTKSEDGGVLGDQMIRYARKNNATVILGSQNVVDVGALRDLISTYFIFGVTNAKEAARALDLVGLDPEDETLQNMISARSFEKGLCLVRMDDRVDVVQADMPPDTLAVLRTEPGAHREEVAA